MIDRIFLDTNLFVYAVDDSGSGKGTVARDVILESLQKKIGVVSHQVIQEFVNVTTYKFKQPISQKNCVLFLETYIYPMWKKLPTKELFNEGMRIQDRYQLPYYDAQIVASALQAKCKKLYTEDL